MKRLPGVSLGRFHALEGRWRRHRSPRWREARANWAGAGSGQILECCHDPPLTPQRSCPHPCLLLLTLLGPSPVWGRSLGALCRRGGLRLALAGRWPQRAGAAPSLPKQYHAVAGQPLVLHTLAAFPGVGRLLGTLVAVAAGDHFLDAYPVKRLS